MEILFKVLIFLMVLFVYIHIHYHLKTNNDLEIYTLTNPSTYKLDEITNIRQPVVFDYTDHPFNNCTFSTLEKKYGIFDINIRNVKNIGTEDDTLLPLKLEKATQLFKNDTEGKYITEQNMDFLNETLGVNALKYHDGFLRPPMMSNNKYDVCTGSNKSRTPLRYGLNFKCYLHVTSGKIKIKLIPPHYTKHLFMRKDYERFEFISPINPWDVQGEYKDEFEKTKVLDVELKAGEYLYLPAYWWYSVEYTNESTLVMFKYRTYMSTLSILPEIVVSLLQLQNVKNNITKKWNKDSKNTDDGEVSNEGACEIKNDVVETEIQEPKKIHEPNMSESDQINIENAEPVTEDKTPPIVPTNITPLNDLGLEFLSN